MRARPAALALAGLLVLVPAACSEGAETGEEMEEQEREGLRTGGEEEEEDD